MSTQPRFFITLLIMFSLLIFPTYFAHAKPYKRPMVINKNKRIALEIWTEMEPKWKTELVLNGKNPIFLAHTPNNVYPPAGMMWVNHAGLKLKQNDFINVAKSTLRTAAKNYGISKKDLSSLAITPKKYGQLKGYEVNFTGKFNNQLVDVKVFTGRNNNKGPITMQVYTAKGKIKHLEEQVRRSWSHTSYLTH